MPIYEYECEKCNAVFEAMQSISAKPLKACNKSSCKGKVHRLVSASGFIFKGSGWFTSEYPSDARKKGWESEKGATADANKNPKDSTTGADKNSTGDKSSDKGTPTPPAPTTGEKEKTQSVSKTPSQKNPYSGSKKPRTKTST